MNPALVQRQLALAGVALLSALGTLAFAREEAGDRDPGGAPQADVGAGRWYVAQVGSYGRGFFGRRTACGVELTPETRGIAHAVLPCGAKIVVSYRGRDVSTEVVDRSVYAAGHEFELTQALADELGVGAATTVRWRFASDAG